LYGVEQKITNGVQVLRDHAQLNLDVALAVFIERITEITVDRTGIDTTVDPQQCQSDAFQIAPRKRPEAAVRVAVFRADTRMKNVGAARRNAEDIGFHQRLAPGEDKVGLAYTQKLLRRHCVHRGCSQHLSDCRGIRKSNAHGLDEVLFPCTIAASACEALPGAEGQNVEKPEPPAALYLAPDALPRTSGGFIQFDDADKIGKTGKPASKSLAVDRRAAMTNENRTIGKGWHVVFRFSADLFPTSVGDGASREKSASLPALEQDLC
jgi:hypothetical protein